MGQEMSQNQPLLDSSAFGGGLDFMMEGDPSNLQAFDFDSFLSMNDDMTDGFDFDAGFLDTNGGVAAGNE